VNRIRIQVGVAYGSDTKLARDILLKVARRHPLVCADPEPLATFDKFADSSLNFTLRCFLPNLDDRLQVINDLHTEIDREFRQAHIEIAFPQQDLHVRTIDAPLRSLLRGEHNQKDAA
jgi:potassium efflux system protein